MEFEKTTLKDAYLIKPQVFQDERGFFMETYSEKEFKEAGIEADFVQDNHSLSVTKGVLRGLHFQNPGDTQAKLVRVTKGAVYGVIVDLRKESWKTRSRQNAGYSRPESLKLKYELLPMMR